MARIHDIEFIKIAGFSGKKLDDLHPGNSFLNMRIDPSNSNPDIAKSAAYFQAENNRSHRQKGNHQKSDTG